MKKLLLLCLTVAFTAACSKSEDAPQYVDAPEGNGVISITTSPSANIETRTQVALPAGTTIPEGGSFTLAISSTDDRETAYNNTWTSIDSFNANYKKTYFLAGTYKAVAEWGDASEEGINKPYFMGQTGFTVVARTLQTVSINAALANTIVKVAFTDRFKSYFEGGAEFKLATQNGNEFAIDYTTSAYYFVQAAKSYTISGKATKQAPSSSVTPETVTFADTVNTGAACSLYSYTFDVGTAGAVTVEIEINDTPSETIIVGNVELNDEAQM